MKQRAVITGMGAITPIGNNVEDFWSNLLAGRSGVGPITLFDPSDYPVKIAAEVKGFDPRDYFDRKDLRMMARPAQLGVASALMALEDAQWKQRPGEGPLGVVGGISNSSQEAIESAVESIQKGGYRKLPPTVISKIFPHSTASETGRITGFQDDVMTLSTGCTSGLNSLGYAAEHIGSGHCSSMLCISGDATLTYYAFAFFCRAGLLSARYHDPEKVSCPFDAKRDGGVLGEGAATFLVEEYDQARRRGVPILAEILGWGTSGIGYKQDQTQDNLCSGMAASMRTALTRANVSPERIDYIGCNGVSDPKLDISETAAIKKVYGEHAYRLPLSSIKSMIGIPLNAAGHLQTVATIKAMNDSFIPPTINYENLDPSCDLDYVPNQARRNRIRLAMVFGHGFNGSDAALILKKHDE